MRGILHSSRCRAAPGDNEAETAILPIDNAAGLAELWRRREKIHEGYEALLLDASEEKQGRFYKGLCDVEAAIAAAPARSTGDLAVKLRLHFHRERNGASVKEFRRSGDFNERLLAASERDLSVLDTSDT